MLCLESQMILQAEQSIKNSHTATHLRLCNNQFIFICIDESINVYSLEKIANNCASLIYVISLNKQFQSFPKDLFEDYITKLFKNAEKQEFAAQIFTNQQDLKSNSLLKLQNIKDRISYFSNNKLKVKKIQIDESGSILVLLLDGRGIVLSHETCKWNSQAIEAKSLNELSKQNIKEACFVPNNLLYLITKDRIQAYETQQFNKISTLKHKIAHINSLCAKSIDKDIVKLYITTNQQIQVLQVNKKKIISSKIIDFQGFINQTWMIRKDVYAKTAHFLYKLDSQDNKTIEEQYQQPCELLYIDQLRNYIKKTSTNNKESLWLLQSTQNGIFIGLTIRKNGNYKEGRLIVFQPNIHNYISKLITNIKDQNKFINMKDGIFINISKEVKKSINEFLQIDKRSLIKYRDLEMTGPEYYAASYYILKTFKHKKQQQA